MANYQVPATQLTPGKLILIKGILGYARLTKLVEGAELVASNKRRVENNKQPVAVPHTSAQLTQAEVQPLDPAKPTLEEIFVQERRYASKKNPETGANYDIDNKSATLPIIAIQNPNGDGTFVQDTSGKELAAGLSVTLVLRVYKPKDYPNCGLSLDQVIVNEPVRYYSSGGGVDTNELAARGIVLSGSFQAVKAGDNNGDAEPVAQQATAAAPVGTTVTNGFAFPSADLSAAPAQTAAPAAAPAAAPVQFNAAPTVVPVTTPQEQAQAPAAPAAETPEQELARVKAELAQARGAGSAFGAAAPAQTGQPWDDAAQMSPGISYQR